MNDRTQWTPAAQRHFDPSADADLANTIVYTLADADAVSPVNLEGPPLYEMVDAEAIQYTLFGEEVAGASRQGTGSIEFRYREYLVKVRSDGWIQVYEPVGPDSP